MGKKIGFMIRDPIHGYCEFSEDEKKIIDSPEFQRLRNIKQLGPVYLIYPGALHTRFEHSLGVCHLAGLVASTINNDSRGTISAENITNLRLASLLHDIGHGPHSHVSEMAYDTICTYEVPIGDIIEGKASNKEHLHETICRNNANKVLERIYSDYNLFDKVTGLITKSTTINPILRDILSSSLDIDKQDYLLRDSYYCGVEYGRFDPVRLSKSFKIINSSIVISEHDVHVVEQFVLARYYMNKQVNHHKTTRKIETMLSRAIFLGALVDKITDLERSYVLNKDFSDLDDTKLLSIKDNREYHSSNFSKVMKNIFEERRLIKCLCRLDYDKDLRLAVANKTLRQLEDFIFEKFSLKNRNLVIVSIEEKRGILPSEIQGVYVKKTRSKLEPVSITEVSDVIRSIYQNEDCERKKPSYDLSFYCFEEDWKNITNYSNEKEFFNSKKYQHIEEKVFRTIKERV